MSTETSMTLTLDDRDEALLLFGSRDQHLRMIREALGIRLVARGELVHIDGTEEQVDQADRVFQQLRQMLAKQGTLSLENVRTVLAAVKAGGDRQGEENLAVIEPGRHARPKTDGHAPYVQPLRRNELIPF